MNPINNLIRGNKLFRKYHFPDFKDEVIELIENGQKPEVLLISCCDSRVTTDFMFGNKPGDLFVLRNIGNFVPPHELSGDFFSVAAAVEYAVNILNVSNIIVCGHSNCGACESLYKDIPEENANIIKWLEIAQPIKEFTLKNKDLYKTKEELYQATEKNSVKFQIKNLLTYPIIKEKILNNNLKIHGWYYSLIDGSILAYDEKKDIFKELDL
ncbi:MAG: carbonic anhydrase [Arcobacter sp.]|nr:MAG: carbonic anhydrase [Arcobacter sp.]